ncbi:hypothetical protein [Paraflavitalea speifideaquila]|uniref:hypothetical protein n=1 Tax=Paraflavitalea speifideaquila TaxID=3076558 RepID=UPI0028F135E7|nr:hypothetical protein [Paraflavitalea speifideiaquila]
MFVIDGIKQYLGQNSNLVFANKNDTLKVVLDSAGYLIKPKELKQREYDVVFSHGGNILIFKNVQATMLIPDQNFEWEFGVDNRPFDKSLGLLTQDEYFKDTTIRLLHYWAFKPLERGDGIVAVNRIK